jgi:ketosteroid isomerase-like protein
MIVALLRRRIRRNFELLERGEIEPSLQMLASDFEFHFPGSHSFAASGWDRAQFRAWLERLARLHPKFEVGEVYVNGPPWRQRIAFRLSDEIAAADGFVYRNEIVECAHARWGRITSLRVFLDTQQLALLDQHLSDDTDSAASPA